MTLDEAILHAEEVAKNNSTCEECRMQHKQLAEWLRELKKYKEGETIKKVETKRLIKKRALNDNQISIGDQVQWKRHPYDTSVYEVKQMLPNGNFFIDNGINAYTDIKPSVLKPVNK